MNRNLILCLLVALVLRLAFVLLAFPALQQHWQLRDDGDGYRPIAQTRRFRIPPLIARIGWWEQFG